MRAHALLCICAIAMSANAQSPDDPAHYGRRLPEGGGLVHPLSPSEVQSALGDWQDADRTALEEFSTVWQRAYQAGDFAAMADLYEPDAWLMTRHQPARKSREAILSYFEAARARGSAARIRFEDESIEIDGDYAFKTAHWWLAVPRANGTTLTDSGRSFVVFRRGADGRWRLWRDIDNNTPDVGPVTEETFP